MNNTEDAWKSLSQAQDWIKVADTKAAALVAANGVLGGLLLKALPPREQWAREVGRTGVLVAGVVLVCLSALLSLWVFAPRLRNGERPSLLYFDHVARCFPEPGEFSARYRTMMAREDRAEEALASQFWACSTIAHRKFRGVLYAVRFLAVAVVLAVVAGLIPS